jgi:ABC-type multidrug transport system fused ATPase/permease subunit
VATYIRHPGNISYCWRSPLAGIEKLDARHRSSEARPIIRVEMCEQRHYSYQHCESLQRPEPRSMAVLQRSQGCGKMVQARANSMQVGVIKFFTVGLFVQGFWYGLHLVRGGLEAGNVVTTFYACLSAIQAAEVILPQWLVLSKGMSAGATLQGILKEARGRMWQEYHESGFRPDSFKGDIEIHGVSKLSSQSPQMRES